MKRPQLIPKYLSQPTMQPRPHQVKAIEDIESAARDGHKKILVVAEGGSGKCHGAGTKILMFNGTHKTVETIEENDLLMGWDSQPREVLSLARGREEMFKVTPVKGEAWTCNRSHILTLQFSGGKKLASPQRLRATINDQSYSLKNGDVIDVSVDDYLNFTKTLKENLKLIRCGVDYPEQAIPLDPYWFGLWLGDGTSINTDISNPDHEVADYCREFAKGMGLAFGIRQNVNDLGKCDTLMIRRPMGALTKRPCRDSQKKRARVLAERDGVTDNILVEYSEFGFGGTCGKANPIKQSLRDMGVLGNKHIPIEYLANSREVRLQLLAGLLDTDGYYSSGYYEICQKSDVLADQILQLARSLGYAAYLAPKVVNGVAYNRITISGDLTDLPIRVERKKPKPRQLNKNVLLTGFTLESLGEGEYFGFTIDGDHHYLLWDHTVTHNTFCMASVARRAYLKGKKTTILLSANCLVTQSLEPRDQTCGALDAQGLRGQYGVFSGAFPSLENPKAPIQVVSLQTLRSRADYLHQILADTDIIIIDECHTSSFFKEVENVYEKWNWKLILNFTASPHNRSQGIDERHGETERNTAMVRMPTYRQMVEMGFLVPFQYHSLDCPLQEKEKLDLSSESAIDWMAQEFVKRCPDPRFTMLFGKPRYQGISQLEIAQKSFAKLGIRFEIVGDETKQADLERILKEYKAGNCNLMSVHWGSTGLDIPRTKNIVLLRPIKSRDKFVQTVTRGSRISPDTSKTHCDVWDFAGNVKIGREGLHPKIEDISETIDDSVLAVKSKGEGEMPEKTCVNSRCKKKIPITAIVCPHCGTTQPRQTIKIVDPSTGQLLSSMSEQMALMGKEYAIAFFRQQRKIAYANGWSPFAAHMQCRKIGIEVGLGDGEYWQGSIFDNPNDPKLVEVYRKYLVGNAPRWNERSPSSWDERKIQNELAREFACVKPVEVALSWR